MRIVGVEPVLHSPPAGVCEVARQLGEMDGMLLEDVNAAVHECPGQLGSPTSRYGGTHRDAGGVDARREVVGIREERNAEALGVRTGGCRAPAQDAGQDVSGAPAYRLRVEAPEVGAADQYAQRRRFAHSTPSSTWSAPAAAPVSRRSAAPCDRRCRTTVSGSSTSQAKCTPAGIPPRSTASTASAPTAAVRR